MKIAVTGSSGFVGRQICHQLAKAGHELYLFDVIHPDWADESCGLPVIGNLATGDGLNEIPWGDLDRVFHLAAAGVKATRRDWMECLQVNVIGTQRLLECLRGFKQPPHLIYARTFYENHIEIPAIAANPYVATKNAGNELIKIYKHQTQSSVTSVTLYQAFGPEDDEKNFVPYVIRQLLQGKQALMGSGKGERDWIFIDDLVDAVVAAGCAPAGDYDLGSGTLHSLRFVAEKISELVGVSPDLLCFDSGKDRNDTAIRDCAESPIPGWKPANLLSEGLQKTIYKIKQKGF